MFDKLYAKTKIKSCFYDQIICGVDDSVVKYHIDIEKISIFFDMIYIKKYRYRFSCFDIYRKNIDIVFWVSIYIEKISILFFRFRYISKKYRYCFSGFDISKKYRYCFSGFDILKKYRYCFDSFLASKQCGETLATGLNQSNSVRGLPRGPL